jgi:hypothetical protein
MASGRTCPLSKSVYEEEAFADLWLPALLVSADASKGRLAPGTKESAARNANATNAVSKIIKPR